MTLPASAKWAPWCHMEALYLGEHIIARVHATPGRGKHQARASFDIDDTRYCAFWRDHPSVEAAKFAMEARLADWLIKAGLA